jgi:hypothetical protein
MFLGWPEIAGLRVTYGLNVGDPVLSHAKTKLGIRRLQASLTQVELARATEGAVPLRTLQRIERLEVDPGVRQLVILSRVLGCQVEDLIEDQWWDEAAALTCAARGDRVELPR